MKPYIRQFFIFSIFLLISGYSQTTLSTVDFQIQGSGYSVTNEYEDPTGAPDYFVRTNDPGRPTAGSYIGVDGYYFGCCDNDEYAEGIVTLNAVNIENYTNLSVTVDVAAIGSSLRYETHENLFLEYSIDGGGWTALMWYSGNAVGAGTWLYEDTDFNGVGDGVQIISSFEPRTYSIPGTGSSLQIRFRCLLNASEDFAFDNINIQGVMSGPEMQIEGNSMVIEDGDVTPSVDDHTDFGTVEVDSEPVVRTFTIVNTGSADLDLTGEPLVAISGSHASDFAVTTLPTSPVASGGTTTFAITFTPGDSGSREAVVSVANNDSDENPYGFSIMGTFIVPEISVLGNGIEIVNGDDTPSLEDHTDFGNVDSGSEPVVRTFTIANTGSADLNLTGEPLVEIIGEDSLDFSVTTLPTIPISAEGTTTFDITFTPGDSGSREAVVSIANDDSDENPYSFAIMGTLIVPEISVWGNDLEIVNGDDSPSVEDHTDFGVALIDSQTVVRTFTIANTGTANLELSGEPIVEITGTHASDFSVTELPEHPVPASSETTFNITFTPGDPGAREATISIANNDSDENSYVFSILGTGEQGVFIEDDLQDMQLPKTTELTSVSPNPFNPVTKIAYQLDKQKYVSIIVMDILGRTVRNLINTSKPADRYTVYWHGKNDAGHIMPSGIYFVVLKAGNIVQTKKVILLR